MSGQVAEDVLGRPADLDCVLSLVGAPPLITTQTDGYRNGNTQAADRRTPHCAARTDMHRHRPTDARSRRGCPSTPADSRWRPRRCRSAVSFAWRTTGDGSLAMVLLDGTYAAAATAAERAPFAAGAEVLIALDDGRDRVPQTLGILSVSLLILGDVSNGACVAGRGDRRDRGRPAGAPARVRLGTRALRRAAARLADRHRLCALDARGAGAAQSPTGGCRSDRTCATAGWTPRSLPLAGRGHRASTLHYSVGLAMGEAWYPRAAADDRGPRAAAGPVAARRASVTIVVCQAGRGGDNQRHARR